MNLNETLTLNICCWNIEGLSKYSNDKSFQKYCSRFNILGFCETWGVKGDKLENILTGYTSFEFMRAKKKSAPRGSGGVSVFVKNDLIQTGRFRRVFENFDDCVILYFSCTDLCDIPNDFVFVFTYVSPEYSPIYASSDDNGIELLNNKLSIISSSYPNAYIFLAGDLNARIKDFQDFIHQDDLTHNFDDNIPYPSDYFSIPRRSRDKEYNRFGLSLIELCCTYDIHLLNGRFSGDSLGNYTCVANNGVSTVDYMICSSELFPYICDFSVLENDKSVHFPIYCEMCFQCKTNINICNDTIVQLSPFNHYRWKTQGITTFHEKFENLYEIFKN